MIGESLYLRGDQKAELDYILDTARPNHGIAMVSTTDAYYELHAERYFERTAFLDFSATCRRFLAHVKPGGRIADVGCGSGRDLLYFTTLGYQVEGIDASASLCRLARAHSGVAVRCVRIEDWKPEHRFDGIWACASLLHLHMDAIEAFFVRLKDFLEQDGVAFFSFKPDIPCGVDNEGRYFTPFTKTDLERVLQAHPELRLIEQWGSGDAMGRNEVTWLSFILGLSRRR